MAHQDASIFDALANVLADLRQRFGDEAFVNRRRLLGFVADYLPEARRELRIVGTLLDEGTVAALAKCQSQLAGIEMDRQTERLVSGTGMHPDVARNGVRAFAFALGKGPKPSSYEIPSFVAAAPSVAWAGLSEPVATDIAPNNAPTLAHSIPAARRKSRARKPAKQNYLAKIGGGNPTVGMAVMGAATIAVAAMQFMGAGDNSDAGDTVQGQVDPTDVTGENYGGELDDFRVAAKDSLESNVGSPTPLTIPGGKRVTTGEVKQMVAQQPAPLLIDVLDSPHQTTLKGAVYIPSAGAPGTVTDGYQTGVKAALDQATNGDRSRALVFFCAGSACWESYNALLRVKAAGYTNLYWYRGGLNSWSIAGLAMENTPAPIGPGLAPPAPAQNFYDG